MEMAAQKAEEREAQKKNAQAAFCLSAFLLVFVLSSIKLV